MTVETPDRVPEVEGPPQVEVVEAPPEQKPKQEKERIMAAKEQAAPRGMPMLSTPLAMMGSNINWLEMINKNMESMHQATVGSVKYLTACQEATFALMRDRMEKNQEMLRACSETRELANLVRESAEYHRGAVEDYVRYTKNLADMTLAAVNDQIDPLEKRTQETLDTVGKAA